MRRERLAHELLVRKWTVRLRRIEESHAPLDCRSDHSYGLLLFGRWSVTVAKPHAAKTNSGYFQTAVSEFAFSHDVLLLAIANLPFDCRAMPGPPFARRSSFPYLKGAKERVGVFKAQ